MRALLVPLLLACQLASANDDARRYLDAVRKNADLILEHGRDHYGPQTTPLFADGLDRETLQPVVWKQQGQTHIICNLAGQQNLLRTLVGLSALTGDAKYHDAARDAVAYAFDHLRAPNGLFYWGGHRYYDLASDTSPPHVYHEFKAHYPFYELFWEVNPAATKAFILTYWNAHLKWNSMVLNRHGRYESSPVNDTWDHPFSDPPAFFIASGELSFCTAGSDLIYAAAWYYKLDGDAMAWTWAERLAGMYEKTRDATTGLTGYQYNRLREDRAQLQFGPEFGPNVTEATLLAPRLAWEKFAITALADMQIGELLGPPARDLQQRACASLKAYARHAYDPQLKVFLPIVTDGRIIRKEDIKRPGYFYAPAGHPERRVRMDPIPPDATYFWSFATAFRLSQDADLLRMVTDIGGQLGALGSAPTSADPEVLLALLELHHARPDGGYLDTARKVGDNILRERRDERGWLLEGPNRANIRFNAMESLALLHLSAELSGRRASIPTAWASKPDFQADYDGKGSRLYDRSVIWDLDRGESGIKVR